MLSRGSASGSDRRRVRRHARLLLATVVSTASTGAVADAQVRIDLSQRTPTGRISEDIEVLLFATELTDGRLLVTSRRRPTPLVADFTANTLVPVSTVGDGPGEFRRPYWILPMPADSTAVGEEGGGRWVVLKGEKPVVTLRAPTGSAVLRLAGADVHGRVLQMGVASYGTEPGQRVFITHANAESLVVVLHSRARVESGTLFAGRPDTVARLRGSFRGVRNRWYTPPGARMPIQYHLSQPLAPEEQALLFKDGWIAIAYASPYRVDWRAPDGRMIRGTPLPFDAVPVDDRQKEAAIAASWPSGASPFTAGDYPPGRESCHLSFSARWFHSPTGWSRSRGRRTRVGQAQSTTWLTETAICMERCGCGKASGS